MSHPESAQPESAGTESLDGRCLCGAVRYRAAGPFQHLVHCHCSMCRKAHGSGFATFVAAPAGTFQWLAGREHVVSYPSTAHSQRHFCALCGGVTPAPEVDGPLAWMPAGGLDGDPGIRPEGHMFVDSRAPWTVLNDDLPKYPAAPPGFEAPEPAATEPAGADGTPPVNLLTGGCLCGQVRFAIRGAPLLLVNCHCSRCRHARGAAHASNLFVLPEQLEWLAGESAITVFNLPGAERFGQNFCAHCGSPVPRGSPRIGRFNVPAGSLDGDPGIPVSHHIYVDSRAPWFEITDTATRYPEAMPKR